MARARSEMDPGTRPWPRPPSGYGAARYTRSSRARSAPAGPETRPGPCFRVARSSRASSKNISRNKSVLEPLNVRDPYRFCRSIRWQRSGKRTGRVFTSRRRWLSWNSTRKGTVRRDFRAKTCAPSTIQDDSPALASCSGPLIAMCSSGRTGSQRQPGHQPNYINEYELRTTPARPDGPSGGDARRRSA